MTSISFIKDFDPVQERVFFEWAVNQSLPLDKRVYEVAKKEFLKWRTPEEQSRLDGEYQKIFYEFEDFLNDFGVWAAAQKHSFDENVLQAFMKTPKAKCYSAKYGIWLSEMVERGFQKFCAEFARWRTRSGVRAKIQLMHPSPAKDSLDQRLFLLFESEVWKNRTQEERDLISVVHRSYYERITRSNLQCTVKIDDPDLIDERSWHETVLVDKKVCGSIADRFLDEVIKDTVRALKQIEKKKPSRIMTP